MTTDIQALRSDAEMRTGATRSRAPTTRCSRSRRSTASSRTSGANDAATATLLDQRDVYIDELSRLMDIKVVKATTTRSTSSPIPASSSSASRPRSSPSTRRAPMTPSAQWDRDPAKRTVGTLTLVSTDRRRDGPDRQRRDPLGRDRGLSRNARQRAGAGADPARRRSRPRCRRRLSDETVASDAGRPSGAQPGFDIDTAGLLAGNTIHLTYTDTLTGQRTMSASCGSTIRPPCRSTTRRPPIRTTKSSASIFPAAWPASSPQLNALFNGKVQFSNPAGSTLRILDDGAANNSTINAVVGDPHA